jgi:hypothetical protein
MQCPFIHPYAYSITILLFTIVTTVVFILLLLLSFHNYYYYKTVATDKLLRASLFLGAAELTTHLLRLINILWLPLCQINKFLFYFPQRLLRSRILVGHQCVSFFYQILYRYSKKKKERQVMRRVFGNTCMFICVMIFIYD